MAAGHIVKNECVDVTASSDAYFSSFPPNITSGTTSYATYFTKVGALWKVKGISISSTGAITNRYEVNATPPAFPTCETTQGFFDGMQIGWAVAAAMIVVYVIRRPYR